MNKKEITQLEKSRKLLKNCSIKERCLTCGEIYWCYTDEEIVWLTR